MPCQPIAYATLDEVRRVVGAYIFPPLAVFGIVGNTLNLVVMNTKGMRNKTNFFLSGMALTDLAFLVFSIPFYLLMMPNLATWKSFSQFIYRRKMWVTTFINWMSSASIWFAIAVTAERLVAIMFPIHAKAFLRMWHLKLISATVFVGTLAINLYNVFWLRPVEHYERLCNMTVLRLEALNRSESPHMYRYVHLSLAIAPYLNVIVPLIVLVILNSLLLRYLHVGRAAMAKAGGGSGVSSRTAYAHINHSRVVELRITLMVVLIIASFIVFQTPSAFVYIWEMVNPLSRKPRSTSFFIAATVSNALVALGKALNFVLYCVVSSSFRRRLIKLLCTTLFSLKSNLRSSFRQTSMSLLSAERSVKPMKRISVPSRTTDGFL